MVETHQATKYGVKHGLPVYLPAWHVNQPGANHGLWRSFNAARGLTLHVCYRCLARRDGWFGKR